MTEMQHSYVISIMSRDRVGIVHEVSQALSEINGDIADIRQSVLCGYFTMILLASFPEKVTARDVERKLAEIDARSDSAIDVMVKQVEGDFVPFRPSIPENAYVLTATGPDKVGFVATVSSFCVKHNINILDLSTTAQDGIYMMILVIDISQCTSISDVRRNLQEFSKQTGLNMVLQHYDIFKAVNDIALPLH